MASKSPRRKEILEKAGISFQVSYVEVSEIPNENLSLIEQIREIAGRKARALVDQGKVLKGQGNWVLSADTLVIVEGCVLGKPRSQNEAVAFLRRLSGKTHQVITALCLWDVDQGEPMLTEETATVTFRQLSEDEITEYVTTGDPMDKAGAYGIQGKAAQFVSSIEGSVENVMGLPIELVKRLLREHGWQGSDR